ncbi:unnamed protein product [Prorocentrum cordatum]|uniref:Uncharacterized protein n=1 Tax=Prorocentrum cordatum TaxID=2364126 RepID=A0ABN9VYA2_9DINO|nr:unnamed protein product [Polarella glacialis]
MSEEGVVFAPSPAAAPPALGRASSADDVPAGSAAAPTAVSLAGVRMPAMPRGQGRARALRFAAWQEPSPDERGASPRRRWRFFLLRGRATRAPTVGVSTVTK